MAVVKLTNIQKLAMDCYKGNVTNYTKHDAEEAIRKEILDRVGGEWNYTNYQKNKWDVFALISELIDVEVNRITAEDLSDFCEIKNVPLGDKAEFKVKNRKLFKVANIADGKNSVRRQRLLNSKVPTTSFRLAVAIYEEFDRFVAGRIDFVDLINTVAASFAHEIAETIAAAIGGLYTGLNTNLKTEGALDEDKLAEICEKVKGASGTVPCLYGSPLALGKIKGAESDIEKGERRQYGYLKTFRSYPMLELPNTYDKDDNTWSLPTDVILVIPNGSEKFVKLALEGETRITENTDGSVRDDQEIEYFMSEKLQLGVLGSEYFGAYKIV